MKLSVAEKFSRKNLIAVVFFFGAFVSSLLLTFTELRREPPGLLSLEIKSTSPGIVKFIYKRDGVLTDPGLFERFQDKTSGWKTVSFSIPSGRYDLLGIKPLVEDGGYVSIRKLRISSSSDGENINLSSFIPINQLLVSGLSDKAIQVTPSNGAKDPFGVFNQIDINILNKNINIETFITIFFQKLLVICLFLCFIYSLSGTFPFFSSDKLEMIPSIKSPQIIGLLAVGILILVCRNTSFFINPTLYTEDGSWISGLINRGFFDMLLNAKEGHARYFVFGNIILMQVALFLNKLFYGLNISNLPIFVSFVAITFYSALTILPLITLKNILRIEARMLLWVLLLLIPMGSATFEIIGRLSNIGFAFLFISFCLLIWRYFSSKESSLLNLIIVDALLFLCANTNPLCYPLIFIFFSIEFIISYYKNSNIKLTKWIKIEIQKNDVRSAFVLLVALFFTGIIIFLRGKGADSFLSGDVNISNIPEMIVGRSFIFPITFQIYSLTNNTISIFLAAIILLISVWVLKKGVVETPLIIGSLIIIFCASFATAYSRPGLTQLFSNYSNTGLDRYYFGITIFSILLFVAILSSLGGILKSLIGLCALNFGVGLLFALYVGSIPYMFELSVPRWSNLPHKTFRDQLVDAYSNGMVEPGSIGPRYKVKLHPDPWVTHFPRDYVVASVLGRRVVPGGTSEEVSGQAVAVNQVSIYDGKVVKQKPAGRGRDDGWFYVSKGSRSWIVSDEWLKKNGLANSSVLEITHEQFEAIPDSGQSLQ